MLHDNDRSHVQIKTYDLEGVERETEGLTHQQVAKIFGLEILKALH